VTDLQEDGPGSVPPPATAPPVAGGQGGGRYQRWREGLTGGYSPSRPDPAREESGRPTPPHPQPSPAQERRSLIGLGGAVAALIVIAALGHFLGVVVVVAVIALVVMLHELGHFTAAKLSGMKVTEYFIGFGPRLWSTRRGETEYGIKAIPAGGYVRIVGMNNLEEVDPADEARSYRQATFPRRFAVAVAGSSVHFVLAIVTVWALFAFAGQAKITPGVGALVALKSASPAEVAGFATGDRILSYDGHKASSWDAMHTFIGARIGQPITFVVRRHGKDLIITATPADGSTLLDTTGTPISSDHEGFLGIEPTSTNYSLLGSIPHGLRTFWDDGVIAAFSGIGAVFGPHGLANIGHQIVSAPGPTPAASAGARPISLIGIVQVAGQVHGWAAKAFLFFEVNAFVGVLNLFPILPFDGGHVVIAVYERIRSRKGHRYWADVNKMVPYAMAMMVLLAFVFLSSAYLDIAHPISLH